MGLRRGLGLAGAIAALALVLASCAQPNSGSANTLGIRPLPAGHGNPLGIHPAGPANEPVCPGPRAAGTAGCTSRVIIDKKGKPQTNGTPQGYSPAQIRTAYGFDSAYSAGNTGVGETIAVVDAYDDPNAKSDLAQFEGAFNPSGGTSPQMTCTLEKLNQFGEAGNYPQVNSGWAVEISLDVEWACAMAPGAHILLVEANDSSFTNLLTAVNTAAGYKGDNTAGPTRAVSMSWGGSEFSSELGNDATFDKSGVVFTASSGDSGTGVIYPAASPYVVGVGGTTLPLDSNGQLTQGQYETAWSGSGGGISAYEPEPGYQLYLATNFSGSIGKSLATYANGMRGVPDVAYDANPSTGFSVYDSTTYQGTSGWFVVGGTSAGSPQWAALFALTDQATGSTLTSGSTSSSPVYRAAASTSNGDNYTTYFNDIQLGSNCTSSGPKHGPHAVSSSTTTGSVCQTTPGYDFVTGLGSPHAGAFAGK